MTEQFKEQGGAATMDPNPLVRWLTSTIMTRLAQPQRWVKKRRQTESQRIKAGRPHLVEYFHQADDGYSHLAAQVLPALAARYEIELVCHLVTGPAGKNVPEPELLLRLSRYDACHVAPDYGLEFPPHEATPDPQLVKMASAILAAQDHNGFIEYAAVVGRLCWTDDLEGLEAMAEQHGAATQAQAEARTDAGTARLQALQHYSGAMASGCRATRVSNCWLSGARTDCGCLPGRFNGNWPAARVQDRSMPARADMVATGFSSAWSCYHREPSHNWVRTGRSVIRHVQ